MKKEPQTRPLIVSAARSRVSERLAMSAKTARELRSYVKWAAKAAGMTEDEAMVLTLDRAVTELLRKDELWQAQGDVAPSVPTAADDSPTGETALARGR